MVVVAMGLVSDARSKRVWGAISKLKSVPFRSPSYTGLPKAFSATDMPACVMAIEAAGKE